MTYSSYEDLVALVPEETLIRLSSDTSGADAVDMETILEVIGLGDRVIDGYAGVRTKVPLDPVPGLIRTISANLAIFNLYRRRSQVPEIWENQYKADMAVLVKISSGQITFGASDNETKSPPASALGASSPKIMGGPGGMLERF